MLFIDELITFPGLEFQQFAVVTCNMGIDEF